MITLVEYCESGRVMRLILNLLQDERDQCYGFSPQFFAPSLPPHHSENTLMLTEGYCLVRMSMLSKASHSASDSYEFC